MMLMKSYTQMTLTRKITTRALSSKNFFYLIAFCLNERKREKGNQMAQQAS